MTEEVKPVETFTSLEDLLNTLTMEQAKNLLADVRNPALRNAALYNAITALLKHRKIEVDPVAAAKPSHPLGALAHGLPPADFDDDNAGQTYQ